MKSRHSLLLLAAACVLAPAIQAQSIRSPVTRVSLLELYTSEGCSSCPPAETWLSGLRDDPRLWRQVVPVAFHVDYWDELGWHDPFDAHVYTERQSRLTRQAGRSVVYTPEFMLNTAEWHNFFEHRPLSLDAETSVGILKLDLNRHTLAVKFSPLAITSPNLNLHVAVLAFGVVTKVGAGENAGRELKHDFLVIGYQRVAMHRSGRDFMLTTPLPEMLAVHAGRYALAAWVSAAGNPVPLQAAGGWLKQAP